MKLREAHALDYDAFYSIKADKNNILWGGFSSAPDIDNFLVWYKKQIDKTSKRSLYVFEVNHKVVGFSSIDYTGDDPEISYGVLSTETGNGFGTEIIRQTCTMANSSRITAYISERNIGSIRCFEKNGFIKTSISETRYLPLFNEQHTFYKWIKVLR